MVTTFPLKKIGKNVIEKTVQQYGCINTLVNNAGVGDSEGVLDTSLEQWESVQAINLRSVFLGMKYVVPEMKKVKGGSIINISSIYAMIGEGKSAAYHASKAGIMGLTKTATVELAHDYIRVEVGAPRLLELFDKYEIKTSWCIPGHTIDTHTDICKEVTARGHEVCHHGYAHENITQLSYDEEAAIMEKGLEALQKIGVTPRGYRSPSWDFSENTLVILEKYGFNYDSSLMGNDFHPYLIRPVEVHLNKGNVYGSPSKILEIPVSWYLDDFPTQESVLDNGEEGLMPVREVFERWISLYDYACEEEGAWFATLGEIYDAFEEKIE